MLLYEGKNAWFVLFLKRKKLARHSYAGLYILFFQKFRIEGFITIPQSINYAKKELFQ